MKFIAVILTLFVITLSVVPCCVADSCADEEVLASQADSHDNEEDLCSPFYSCAACTGFTSTYFSVTPVAPLEQGIIYYAEHKQSFFTRFHHAIWQPPRIS